MMSCLLCALAFGPEKVLGVLMPSPYSSRGSVDDSLQLAANLAIATGELDVLAAPIRTGPQATSWDRHVGEVALLLSARLPQWPGGRSRSRNLHP